MCRLAAFVGSRRSLATLMFDPPHSLEHQAYAPDLLVRGHVNVDGSGVAWWPEGDIEPLRYITERPPWSDPNLGPLSRRIEATTAIAAVRSAAPGIPFGPGNVQPFVFDGMAGVHNGWIGGFRAGVGRDLIGRLPDDLFAELDALNDSRVLILHTVALLREGAELAQAVVESVALASKMASKRGEAATLNLAVAVRDRIVAVRSSHDAPHNSLFVAAGPDGHRLASEPLDDAETWIEVPVEHLVDLRPDGFEVSSLSDGV